MDRAKPVNMKNSTINNASNDISSTYERDNLENKQEKSNFSSKAVKTMTEQLIAPPARVWDKIQAILDEQDNRRKSGESLIQTSFGVHLTDAKRKKVYLAAVAGLSVVAGLVWFIR